MREQIVCPRSIHAFDTINRNTIQQANSEIIEGSGSFRCHARLDEHPGFPMPITLDSRLRGNDGGPSEKYPDPSDS